jgi:aryl-phospho-beta-D-glucosidase BglC (GH1 family)
MPKDPAFLKTERMQIQNQAGQAVILRGVGLGGWMNMENFVAGYPTTESDFRRTVARALGKEKAGYFFDRYLECFFTEADAQFIRSLGLNTVRLPFNYRHFEDDLNPFVLRAEGFKHLDRAVEICARQGLYTILDLHAAPGCQNQDWHSDNPTARALFWEHKHFQDRTVWLWENLAEHYKDNPWVAGYNPLNEPSDPSGEALDPFYRRVVAAIRTIDPDHMIFLEGNRYSQDFSALGAPLPNVVYSLHNYAAPGFIQGGPYPGVTRGEYIDQAVLREKFQRASRYMREAQTPIWVGEFGPVYSGDPQADAMRYRLLRDQLAMYEEIQASWSLWTYKDIGLQGIVSLSPESRWMRLIQPILAKKTLLGVDSWGGVDTHVRHILDPLEQTFTELFPNYQPYPFTAHWQIHRLVRNILLAEPLLEDFLPLLQGLDCAQIDELMDSFRFQNCAVRQELCRVLSPGRADENGS